MAYQSKHTGTAIDNGIDINTTQNNRLTTLETNYNSLNTYAHNLLVDNSIKTSYIQNQAVTEDKLADSVKDALSSIKIYSGTLKASNWIDDLSITDNLAAYSNKWKWEKFNSTSYTMDSNVRNLLLNVTPNTIRYDNDPTDSGSAGVNDWGENYTARCSTYIYCTQDYNYSAIVQTDDQSCVYLNGTFLVYVESSNTDTTVTLPFKRGVNLLEIIYRENTGKDGYYIRPKISNQIGLNGITGMYAIPGHTFYQTITPVCLNGNNNINSNTLFSAGMLFANSFEDSRIRDLINSGYIIGNNDHSITIKYDANISINKDITLYWYGFET